MNKFEPVLNKKNDDEPILPKRQTMHSAGYDFYSPYDILVPANGHTQLHFTDVKVRLDDDCVLMLYPRSSMGNKGMALANTTGIIDADYYNNESNEGNIGFMLRNFSNEDIFIEKGERFMQGLIVKYFVTSDDDVTTERVGGYGSTK